jgi:hypothetical protein
MEFDNRMRHVLTIICDMLGRRGGYLGLLVIGCRYASEPKRHEAPKNCSGITERGFSWSRHGIHVRNKKQCRYRQSLLFSCEVLGVEF